MKKRLVALALCLVFTGTLIAVPKARASLVGAGAAAVGAAVLATYMAASGLTINTDSAETITTGLDSLAEDYLTDTGSTETAESWLSTIAGLVTIPGAGVLQLPASVVRIVGGFVSWLIETFSPNVGVETPVFSSDGFRMLDGTIMAIPTLDFSAGRENILTMYPDAPLYRLPCNFDFAEGVYLHFSVTSSGYLSYEWDSDGGGVHSSYSSSVKNPAFVLFARKVEDGRFTQTFFDENKAYVGYVNFLPKLDTYLGVEAVSNSLDLTRGAGFSDIVKDKYASDDESRSLSIFLPQTITKADDLPVVVPELIINGELAPTYELTQEGTGEGTDTEDGTGADDTTVGLLQSILQRVKSIGNTFTDSLTDAFTPSQEAVDSLAAEVDAKLPIIPTLQNFGSDLMYKLEHPDECANGLGLTTVVDLKKGRGTYLGNTAHNLLDVSWYLEYKPLVDDIIVGFCWLGFLWNCYGALPRIIHGEGAIAGAITVLRKEDTGDDR